MNVTSTGYRGGNITFNDSLITYRDFILQQEQTMTEW
jgi:hypothetical protein